MLNQEVTEQIEALYSCIELRCPSVSCEKCPCFISNSYTFCFYIYIRNEFNIKSILENNIIEYSPKEFINAIFDITDFVCPVNDCENCIHMKNSINGFNCLYNIVSYLKNKM